MRVRFDEPVHHVTTDNLVVRLVHGRMLDARLTCADVDGTRTPCNGGGIRSAQLQPTVHLKPGRTYVAIVDPAGVAPIRDRVGNATPRVRSTFSFS